MNLRDKLRAAALGAVARPTKLLTIGGVEVELRTPTITERSALYRAATKGEDVDMAKLTVAACIECTYVPGGDERLFDQADVEALSGAPSGSELDKLMLAASAMINPSVDDAKKS